jgi:hypothetical protein
MHDIDAIYNELNQHLSAHRQQFIAPHLPADPQANPQSFATDVKAYCVLSHAALEDYFETVSLSIMSQAIDRWTNTRQLSDCIIMLLGRYGLHYSFNDDDTGGDLRVFDSVREILAEAKIRFSRDIHDNHGVSLRHLRKLIAPIGFDFIPDANASNAFIQLSKERGLYAHKGRALQVLSPEDADAFVSDCLRYAEWLRDEVKRKGWV